MPENVSVPAPFEDRSIVLKHPHEVAFWMTELAATEMELREAVRKAGPNVQDVKRYLTVVWRYLGKLPADTALPPGSRKAVARPDC